MGSALEVGTRDTLTKLAEQLFPLEVWVKDAQKYVPPIAGQLPWRKNGVALSIASLRVVDRLEQLIGASADDEKLRVRWNKVAGAPLWLEPELPHSADWRVQHMLDEAAVFAPVDSDNFVIGTDDPKSKVKKPRARAEFYAACWPLLSAARAECLFPDNTSWLDFGKSLYADALSAWPPTGTVKSSDFMKRFAKDIAICLMDQENPFFGEDAEGTLWRRAVLIEAGEHRFRHNAYAPDAVKTAVDALEAKLIPLL